MDSMSTKCSLVNLSFSCDNGADLLIRIDGKLTIHSVSSIWDKAFQLQRKYLPQTLAFDAKDLAFVDSVGATLILELKKRQLEARKEFILKNPSSGLLELLSFLDAGQDRGPSRLSPAFTRLDFISRVGKLVVDVWQDVKANLDFLGRLATYFFQLLRFRRIRYQDFWRAMEDVGPKALPIVFLIGFLVGIIITFQSAEPFRRFGAQIYIVDLVGLGLVREMGPLMTAILLASRTASAFAAEIGSMKINQEIDALSTMGIDAINFLAVPRILAATIMTPFLSMFLIFSGLLGCFLIMLSLGYSPQIIIRELYGIVTIQDFFAGLIKTFVFGAIIAGVGCLHGIKTKLGASAVGVSTTRAVVSSLIMLTVVDGIFAVVYYVLGI